MKRRIRWIKPAQILVLTSTCLFSCLLFESGLYLQEKARFQELRESEQWYGSWDAMAVDVRESDINTLKQDPMIESVGTVRIIDVLSSHVPIRCGQADQAFFKQARLRLKEGRYPENPGEALIESSVLDELKRSYTLGQELKLELENEEIRYVTIVGIIDPYRSGWTWGSRMPALFTTLTNIQDSTASLLLQSQDGWEQSLPDKTQSLTMVMNERLELAPQPASTLSWSLVILAFITAVLFPWIWLTVLFRKRELDLSILKLRGRSTRQLGWDLLRVLQLAEIPALILCFFACFHIPRSWLCIGSFMVIPSTVVRVCRRRLQSIPAAINAHATAHALLPDSGIKTGKVMQIQRLAARLGHTGSRQQRIQHLALMVCMTTCVICLGCVGQEKQPYNEILEVPDFSLEVPGTAYTNHQTPLHMQQLAAIKSVNGVKKTTAAMRESGWVMDWEDHGQSCIRDIFVQDGAFIELSPDDTGDLALYPELIVLQDGPLKTQVLDFADVSEETFESDDSAIICLPSFQHFYQEEYGSGEIRYHDFVSEKEVWSETTIQPGTQITLRDADQRQTQLTISGILREPPEVFQDSLSLWDQVPGAGSPYSLFVDASFLKGAFSTVHIWTEPAAGNLAEKEISQLASRMKLNHKNRYSEKTRIMDSLRFQYQMLYLISAVSALSCLLILLQLLRQQNQKLEILCRQLRQVFIPPSTLRELKRRFQSRVLLRIAVVLTMGAVTGCILTPDISDPDRTAALYYQMPGSEHFDTTDNP
ncbi:hypothetical protein [Faecalibaculum rodentium]|uniref:hypothetical protein n=1 Tax=Faecalibaculum rodentium TaxID=1702221 RepID=UPI003F739728